MHSYDNVNVLDDSAAILAAQSDEPSVLTFLTTAAASESNTNDESAAVYDGGGGSAESQLNKKTQNSPGNRDDVLSEALRELYTTNEAGRSAGNSVDCRRSISISNAHESTSLNDVPVINIISQGQSTSMPAEISDDCTGNRKHPHESDENLIKFSVQCDICQWNFDNDYYLQVHKAFMHTSMMETENSNSRLSMKRACKFQVACCHCTLVFDRPNTFEYHLKAFHQDGRYLCNVCGKLFELKGSLLIHERVAHHPILTADITCRFCAKKFTNKYRRNIHEKKMHIDLANIDESTILSTMSALNRSLAHHQRQSVANLQACKSKDAGITRRRFQSDDKYMCSTCNENFGTKAALIIHSITHVKSNMIPTIASVSGDGSTGDPCTSANQTMLEEHITVDKSMIQGEGAGGRTTKMKQRAQKKNNILEIWECSICKKRFTTKYFLRKHKRLHTGEKPYECQLCKRKFAFQQSYHKHMLYHTDVKPYRCAVCGKAFKESSTLQNHQRIHTGERPYECETCGKSFRQRVSYLVHRRIHTGILPYECKACKRFFRYKVTQRTHNCHGSKLDGLAESTTGRGGGNLDLGSKTGNKASKIVAKDAEQPDRQCVLFTVPLDQDSVSNTDQYAANLTEDDNQLQSASLNVAKVSIMISKEDCRELNLGDVYQEFDSRNTSHWTTTSQASGGGHEYGDASHITVTDNNEVVSADLNGHDFLVNEMPRSMSVTSVVNTVGGEIGAHEASAIHDDLTGPGVHQHQPLWPVTTAGGEHSQSGLHTFISSHGQQRQAAPTVAIETAYPAESEQSFTYDCNNDNQIAGMPSLLNYYAPVWSDLGKTDNNTTNIMLGNPKRTDPDIALGRSSGERAIGMGAISDMRHGVGQSIAQDVRQTPDGVAQNQIATSMSTNMWTPADTLEYLGRSLVSQHNSIGFQSSFGQTGEMREISSNSISSLETLSAEQFVEGPGGNILYSWSRPEDLEN